MTVYISLEENSGKVSSGAETSDLQSLNATNAVMTKNLSTLVRLAGALCWQ